MIAPFSCSFVNALSVITLKAGTNVAAKDNSLATQEGDSWNSATISGS